MIKYIKERFKNNTDLVIREINYNIFNKIYIIYLETLSSSDKVNSYILDNLSIYKYLNKRKLNKLNNIIPSPKVVEVDLNNVESLIYNGYTILINKNCILGIDTKKDLSRSINKPDMEPTIKGPQDSFIENIESNIGLIKRRIKTSKLKNKDIYIGRRSNTKISILYIEDICNIDIVNKLEILINKLDIDGILDSNELAHYIEGENNSVFPTIKSTERPDVVCKSLLDGKVSIVVDTSPFVLILPSYFIDFIHPISDYYTKSINVNFLKFLRLSCFILSMIIPSVYLALVNYNQETIPTSLLINFSTQRVTLPFPTLIEALIMLFIVEILRESDIRFPSNFGSSISILGALILGDAAVSAGLVSPIMIIIISLTFISSLIFTELELSNALRNYRILFLIFSGFLGLYGVFLASIIFLVNILSINTIDKPYFSPIIPFNKEYFISSVSKVQDKYLTKRSTLTTNKNFIRRR